MVVIWPKALGVSSVSTTYVIQIVSANGVEELLAADGISVYPNPCNEQLNIKNLAPENPIEQVRFLDADGKLILMRTRQQRIDLSEIPNGMYMVELYYKSGARKILKVQKQQ